MKGKKNIKAKHSRQWHGFWNEDFKFENETR